MEQQGNGTCFYHVSTVIEKAATTENSLYHFDGCVIHENARVSQAPQPRSSRAYSDPENLANLLSLVHSRFVAAAQKNAFLSTNVNTSEHPK